MLKYFIPFLFIGCAAMQTQPVIETNHKTIHINYYGGDRGFAAAKSAAKQWYDVCGKRIEISRRTLFTEQQKLDREQKWFDNGRFAGPSPEVEELHTAMLDTSGIPLMEVIFIKDIVPAAPDYASAITNIRIVNGRKTPEWIIFEMAPKELPDKDFEGRIVHEFGHVLGIHHHTDKGLMREVPSDDPNDLIVSTRECKELP
jgi:hypothetical protein